MSNDESLISIDLAYKWLNCDTYWDINVEGDDETDQIPSRSEYITNDPSKYPPELIIKYPLTSLSGKPRGSRLHDPNEHNLKVRTVIEQLVDQLRKEIQNKNLADARAHITQIEIVCSGLQKSNTTTDRLQITEARLETARACRTMGENAKAVSYTHLTLPTIYSV